MKEFDFTVTGGAATVRVFKFHKMPGIGQTETAINTNADEVFYGGCGFNVFHALADLGARVYPVLCYADPQIKDKLEQICDDYNLPQNGLFGPEGESYYSCIMFQDDDRNHITIAYNYGKDAGSSYSENVDCRDEFFKNSRMIILVVGPPETTYKIIEMAKKHNKPLAYAYRNDPVLVPKDVLELVLSETSILFTNEAEAEYIKELFGYKSITDLMYTGKANIIVTTLGKNGCIVYEKQPDGTIKKITVPVTENERGNVDAIGAGDGFVAGFMFGYAQGKSLTTCAQYGNTVSSFVIEKDGSTTNLPTCKQMIARNNKRPDAVKD